MMEPKWFQLKAAGSAFLVAGFKELSQVKWVEVAWAAETWVAVKWVEVAWAADT